jgi:flagellar biogenesis protein FliO
MIYAIMKMMVGMGVVFLFLVGLSRLLKKTDLGKRGFPSDPGIRLLTSKPIGPRQHISLVEIGGEVLALGVSEGGIRLLTKIENKEFIEKVRIHPPMTPERFSIFRHLPKKGGWFGIGFLRNIHGR